MEEMSSDIERIVLEKLHASGKFALQMDKSMDISGMRNLWQMCALQMETSSEKMLFFCKELPQREDIIRVVSDYLELKDDWGGKTASVFALMEQLSCSDIAKDL